MIKLPEFKNKNLLKQAFTHRSYLNEAKEEVESNERLEFLGDSVLSVVVSEYLFKKYTSYDEGKLTNLRALLVNTKHLAENARKLQFGANLRLSKGEEESKGRENQSLLADCFEAFIGGLYLDQGLNAVKEFIESTILVSADEFVRMSTFKDPKSLLQEHVQARKQKSPVYKVMEEEGPAHAKTFTVGVYIGTVLAGTGRGKSKQEAEENAAIEALSNHQQTPDVEKIEE